MIVLKSGVGNIVNVAIENTIDISGFSATLSIGSLTKTIADLAAKSAEFVFSAEEVDAVGAENFYGVLQIQNADNELYLEMRPQFHIIDSEGDSTDSWLQTLYIIVVGDFSVMRTGGVPKDIVRKSDFEGIGEAKGSVHSCQKTINEILECVSS